MLTPAPDAWNDASDPGPVAHHGRMTRMPVQDLPAPRPLRDDAQCWPSRPLPVVVRRAVEEGE